MEIGSVISFIGASIILILMPGPDNIFVLTESITKGHKNGIAISVGLCSGILIHTLAAATGLSIIIQKSAMVFSVVKYLGAGYLFYLAFMTFKEKRLKVEITKSINDQQTGFFKLWRTGILMNVLNPKVALFFMALLPQFVNENGYSVTWQMIWLGMIFLMLSLTIFSLVALLAGSLAKYLNRPRFWQIAKFSKVGILTVLGIGLMLSRK